jgi:hypothetical protein
VITQYTGLAVTPRTDGDAFRDLVAAQERNGISKERFIAYGIPAPFAIVQDKEREQSLGSVANVYSGTKRLANAPNPETLRLMRQTGRNKITNARYVVLDPLRYTVVLEATATINVGDEIIVAAYKPPPAPEPAPARRASSTSQSTPMRGRRRIAPTMISRPKQ